MTETVRIAPPNSLLLVLDPSTGLLPETLGGGTVTSTASSLAIGTLAEFDGETEVNVSSPGELPVDRSLTLRWEGTLETSGRLAVLTIYNETVIDMPAAVVARVEVWTNDPDEPDLVWVVNS